MKNKKKEKKNKLKRMYLNNYNYFNNNYQEARLKKKERVKIRNDWYDSEDQFEDVIKIILK